MCNPYIYIYQCSRVSCSFWFHAWQDLLSNLQSSKGKFAVSSGVFFFYLFNFWKHPKSRGTRSREKTDSSFSHVKDGGSIQRHITRTWKNRGTRIREKSLVREKAGALGAEKKTLVWSPTVHLGMWNMGEGGINPTPHHSYMNTWIVVCRGIGKNASRKRLVTTTLRCLWYGGLPVCTNIQHKKNTKASSRGLLICTCRVIMWSANISFMSWCGSLVFPQ